MKKISIVTILIMAVAVGAFSFSACAEQADGVWIDPPNVVLLPEGQATLTVKIMPEGYSQKCEVAWAISANPEDCVTLAAGIAADGKETPDCAVVTAVKIGVAVVKATVSTKFSSLEASCTVRVEGAVSLEFTEVAAPAAVIRLNAVAPSGVSDGEVQIDKRYYYGLSGDRLSIWNLNSRLASEDGRVLGAYQAAKGDSAGAIIVNTETKGQKGMLNIFTAVDESGKLLAMRVDDGGAEDFFAEDKLAGFSEEFADKALSELTAAGFIKHLTKKDSAPENVSAALTANAYVMAIKMAAELFAAYAAD
ncbi:MAG: hypothetical protein FWD58_03645 [Firmicutes bacterium]|nr:hypothetical protein [Bacillota bacterium]